MYIPQWTSLASQSQNTHSRTSARRRDAVNAPSPARSRFGVLRYRYRYPGIPESGSGPARRLNIWILTRDCHHARPSAPSFPPSNPEGCDRIRTRISDIRRRGQEVGRARSHMLNVNVMSHTRPGRSFGFSIQCQCFIDGARHHLVRGARLRCIALIWDLVRCTPLPDKPARERGAATHQARARAIDGRLHGTPPAAERASSVARGGAGGTRSDAGSLDAQAKALEGAGRRAGDADANARA